MPKNFWKERSKLKKETYPNCDKCTYAVWDASGNPCHFPSSPICTPCIENSETYKLFIWLYERRNYGKDLN